MVYDLQKISTQLLDLWFSAIDQPTNHSLVNQIITLSFTRPPSSLCFLLSFPCCCCFFHEERWQQLQCLSLLLMVTFFGLYSQRRNSCDFLCSYSYSYSYSVRDAHRLAHCWHLQRYRTGTSTCTCTGSTCTILDCFEWGSWGPVGAKFQYSTSSHSNHAPILLLSCLLSISQNSTVSILYRTCTTTLEREED